MTLGEFRKVKTGSLIEYHGDIYFAILTDEDNPFVIHDYEIVREWFKKYSVEDKFALIVYAIGYNIDDMSKLVSLNLYSDETRLSKKQFSQAEIDTFMIKLKMSNKYCACVDYKKTFEIGKFYRLCSGISHIQAELYRKLSCNSLMRNYITTFSVLREEDTYFEVYTILLKSPHELYYFKKTKIDKDSEAYKPFVNALSYPYYSNEFYVQTEKKYLKPVTIEQVSKLDLYDFDKAYEDFERKINTAVQNKDSDKEMYGEYLLLVYWKKHNILLDAFVRASMFLAETHLIVKHGNKEVINFVVRDLGSMYITEMLRPFVERLSKLIPDTKYTNYSDIVVHSYYDNIGKYPILDLPYITVDRRKKLLTSKQNGSYAVVKTPKEGIKKYYDISFVCTKKHYFSNLANFN